MPCRSDGYEISESESHQISSEELKKIDFLEAALCATIREFEAHDLSLDYIDYKEAGITKKQLVDWFRQHKKKDDERIKNEAKKLAKLKKSAEEKAKKLLTAEERKILGLK